MVIKLCFDNFSYESSHQFHKFSILSSPDGTSFFTLCDPSVLKTISVINEWFYTLRLFNIISATLSGFPLPYKFAIFLKIPLKN